MDEYVLIAALLLNEPDGRCTPKADSLTPSRPPITSLGQCPLYGALRSRPRTYSGRAFWDAMTTAISGGCVRTRDQFAGHFVL